MNKRSKHKVRTRYFVSDPVPNFVGTNLMFVHKIVPDQPKELKLLWPKPTLLN